MTEPCFGSSTAPVAQKGRAALVIQPMSLNNVRMFPEVWIAFMTDSPAEVSPETEEETEVSCNYSTITKVFEARIIELKTPPKKDMRFARQPDRTELARNSESAWQIFLLWRDLLGEHRQEADERRLMSLATAVVDTEL